MYLSGLFGMWSSIKITLYLDSKNVKHKMPNGDIYIREYQDLDFFPDQLQTFIERCIGPQRFQM